jgi:hypothetical protein
LGVTNSEGEIIAPNTRLTQDGYITTNVYKILGNKSAKLSYGAGQTSTYDSENSTTKYTDTNGITL